MVEEDSENALSFGREMAQSALRWGLEHHKDPRMGDTADSVIATIYCGALIIETVGRSPSAIPLVLYQELVKDVLNAALDQYDMKVVVKDKK